MQWGGGSQAGEGHTAPRRLQALCALPAAPDQPLALLHLRQPVPFGLPCGALLGGEDFVGSRTPWETMSTFPMQASPLCIRQGTRREFRLTCLESVPAV